MPPRQKITRASILDAALKIVTLGGYDKLNARNVGNAIQASTQPIYQQFKDMSELKTEVFYLAKERAKEQVLKGIDKSDFLISLSKSYISLALNQPRIFELVYLNPIVRGNQVAELKSFLGEGENLLGTIGKKYNLSPESSEKIFERVWYYIHGLASLIVCGEVKASKEEIFTALSEGVDDISRSLLIRDSL